MNSMLNIVIGGIILTTMTLGFLYACVVSHYNFDRLLAFPYEIFGMIVNALVGIIGFGMYMTYLPVLGEVRLTSMTRLEVDCLSSSDCAADANIINVFTIVSSVRFLFWYGEFLTSFLYIMLAASHGRTMTLLRYVAHAMNTALSALTFGIVASTDFPRHSVVGGTSTAPVVGQMLLLVWALMSFWFIAQSPLYRVQCLVLRPIRFHGWRSQK